MPKGVYKRTELHRDICAKAGRASALSSINKERYKSKNVVVICKNCENKFTYPVSQARQFCDKKCFDQYQTHSEPKTYSTIHAWIRRNFGTPNECEHCGTLESRKFEWANISGEYELDRSDWARLCCKCHRRYDLGIKNKIEVLNV